MTPIISALLSSMNFNGMQPTLVEQVSDNLIYVGYCLPTCTGTSDPKWLVKRIQTIGTIQTIYFANGVRLFNQKWDDRATLSYQMTDCEVSASQE